MLTSEAARVVELVRKSSDAKLVCASLQKLPPDGLNGDGRALEVLNEQFSAGRMDGHSYLHRVKCRLQSHWLKAG